ncbi:MAG TPA: hypothetical protein VMU80_08545 [Bryobacteraceae bacterium]|nr:hypothetical protein [Bryobacteraceae bacterium]
MTTILPIGLDFINLLSACQYLGRKRFQDAAVGDAPFSRTPILDTAQFRRQFSQIHDALLNILQVLRGNAVNAGALPLRLAAEVQKIANFVQRKAQLAAASSELQAMQMLLPIDSVIALASSGRRYDPDLFVIPDGHHLHSSRVR